MNRRWILGLTCGLLAACALQSTLAQQVPSDELQEIHKTLARIADALEAQQRDREIDLLIKRIELEQRRLEPVQRRLEVAEKDVREAELEARKIEDMRAGLERTVQAQQETGKAGPGGDMRPMLQGIDAQLDTAAARLSTAQERARALQAEIDRGRQQMAQLDKKLSERVER